MEEITITGARAVKRTFERAAALFERRVIDAEVFVTHRFSLDEFSAAISAFEHGDGVKVHLVP